MQKQESTTVLNPDDEIRIDLSPDADPTEVQNIHEATEESPLWVLFAGICDSEGRRLRTTVDDIHEGDEVASVTYDEAFENGTPEILRNNGWPSWYECTEVYYDPEGYVVLDPVIIEAHAHGDDEVEDPGVFLIPIDEADLVAWEARHPAYDEGQEIDPEELPQF